MIQLGQVAAFVICKLRKLHPEPTQSNSEIGVRSLEAIPISKLQTNRLVVAVTVAEVGFVLGQFGDDRLGGQQKPGD
jgi:hypothetical protein